CSLESLICHLVTRRPRASSRVNRWGLSSAVAQPQHRRAPGPPSRAELHRQLAVLLARVLACAAVTSAASRSMIGSSLSLVHTVWSVLHTVPLPEEAGPGCPRVQTRHHSCCRARGTNNTPERSAPRQHVRGAIAMPPVGSMAR